MPSDVEFRACAQQQNQTQKYGRRKNSSALRHFEGWNLTPACEEDDEGLICPEKAFGIVRVQMASFVFIASEEAEITLSRFPEFFLFLFAITDQFVF